MTLRKPSRHRTLRASITLLASIALAAASAAAAAASPAAAGSDVRHACTAPARPGVATCLTLIRTNVPQRTQAQIGPDAAPVGFGYGPASLQSAYSLPSSTAGAGQTVAIVDAFDYPTAAADLANYRSSWSLPACNTSTGAGCLTKVNQNGAASPLPAPSGATGWATEEALDIEMVSAGCPNCKILLVEANTPTTTDLGTAVNSAVSLGAKFVSNSYGSSESSSDPSTDTSFYNHPGVAVTASAGDSGFGVSFPAASPHVTAVGGTSLTTASNSRGWTETVWSGTGSGCSAVEAKPSFQTDTGCARRTNNDVSAVADPNTGVAVYDTYDQGGWLQVGGTSVSSPLIASIFALAGTPAAGTYPNSYPYAHTSSLFDVTSGSDGSCSPAYLCTGEVGYDGPTGWGTPNGTAAFTSGGGGGNTVTVTNPGSQSWTVGTAVSLQIHATDSASGQTLTYSATGLPSGLAIGSSSGLISGTPTTASSGSVTVTVRDTTGASGSATFSWSVSTVGGGCTAAQLLGNPGFETGSISPWTSTPAVLANTSFGVPAHSGSWLAWLDGYASPHTDTVAQSVTIPATCKNATLSFWLDISTNDPTTAASDTFKIQVLNSGGTVLSTLGTFSNLNSTGGYAQHSFPLTSFIGQTITVKYTGTETLSGFDTSFFNDDNAITVS